MTTRHHSFASPLGHISVTEDDGAITTLRWASDGSVTTASSAILQEAETQLSAYFAGTRTRFDLPLRVVGSEFQRAICDAITAIPFGETRTYGDIARDLAVPAQAVGQGCGSNPIPLLIPCHRVLGRNGLGGFSGSGGVEAKVWLLRHEGAGGLLI
ncbi:methylated-DNA--[protein]-cysteine S-methyltransferase [Sagittula sp. NFXS13]|uniref:methylated-DNA--[protein]-cysteine S-methyltransferase n=1 Tax=Sagittula sp. NFXS13 TaxID=2819095 RepID=UPI0032DFFEDA